MNIKFVGMKKIAVFILFAFGIGFTSYAQTPGTLELSVTTLENDTKYSPKHVLAIWVEDANGDFVKTLKMRGDDRKKYLITWWNNSSGNTTDAVTGSTLKDAGSHTVSWDCTNTSGTLVDDGSYTVRVEFTSEHAQGPLTEIDFTKSETSVDIQPSNETYFTDMDLVFTPESATEIEETSIDYQLKTYPNPISDILNIEMTVPSRRPVSIKVYQSDMKLLAIIWDGELSGGKHAFSWNTLSNGRKVAAGNYFVVVRGDNLYSSRQLVVR